MQVYDTPPPGHMMAIGPEDTNSGANAGMWGSLENARGAYLVFGWGDTNGGTTVITLFQAQDSAGTGSKELAFTTFYQGGQRLTIGSTTVAFAVAGTALGGGSSNQGLIYGVSSNELVVVPTVGSTTWTDGETITSGSASATLSGTGQDEDIWVKRETASSTTYTFTTVALTWTKYCIPVDETMLDVANGFNHFKLYLAATGSGSALGWGEYWFYGENIKKSPGISYMGTQKTV